MIYPAVNSRTPITSLVKYFKYSALLPVALTLVTGIVLIILHDGTSYTSEWFTDDGFDETIMLTFLLSVLIALASLPLLLNKLSRIKENILLSIICWLLLPSIICSFVIYEEILNFTGNSGITANYEGNWLLDTFIMSVAIAHILCLLLGFIHHRLRLKSQGLSNKS